MKYHPNIKWDFDYHKEYLVNLAKLNPILWKISKARGRSDDLGTSNNCIYIHHATKEEYHKIVNALNLGVSKKKALSNLISAVFSLDDISIKFIWDLPESCEVIYNEEPISEDEIIRVRKTVKEIICEKPLMQSVFPDWVEEENGVIPKASPKH